jgi:hypothetical protein
MGLTNPEPLANAPKPCANLLSIFFFAGRKKILY